MGASALVASQVLLLKRSEGNQDEDDRKLPHGFWLWERIKDREEGRGIAF
jgi:hypothetical protein